jgi:pyruvate kinase
LNKQGGGLSAPALTDKDRRDIESAARYGLDFMSVSFARNAEDIEEARSLLRAAGGQAHIVAKIERAEAVQHIRSIIDASDIIMVARGDLAVEVGYASMTGLQKGLIRLARARNKVVITATQMLESMINCRRRRAPRCRRRERRDGRRDAVMLSPRRPSGDTRCGREHDGGACVGAEKHETFRRAANRLEDVRARGRGDRDGRDVRRESLERARDHRADRVGLDDAVDVARALRHSRIRVHAARGDAAA